MILATHITLGDIEAVGIAEAAAVCEGGDTSPSGVIG
jgi:hypothetical protein